MALLKRCSHYSLAWLRQAMVPRPAKTTLVRIQEGCGAICFHTFWRHLDLTTDTDRIVALAMLTSTDSYWLQWSTWHG